MWGRSAVGSSAGGIILLGGVEIGKAVCVCGGEGVFGRGWRKLEAVVEELVVRAWGGCLGVRG